MVDVLLSYSRYRIHGCASGAVQRSAGCGPQLFASQEGDSASFIDRVQFGGAERSPSREEAATAGLLTAPWFSLQTV